MTDTGAREGPIRIVAQAVSDGGNIAVITDGVGRYSLALMGLDGSSHFFPRSELAKLIAPLIGDISSGGR